VRFQNQNVNKSFVFIEYNTYGSAVFGKWVHNRQSPDPRPPGRFINVDRRSIEVRLASFANISGNVFIGCGSRSVGNPTNVLITGSDKNKAVLYFDNNTMTQTRDIIDDMTNSHVNPGHYAHVWITGYLNGSLVCIRNNNISGGAIGLRLSGMSVDTADSCINATEVPGFFDDDLDFLRKVWYVNQNITGYVQCIVYGDPHQDFFNTWKYCCGGCLGVLDACNVSLTDPKYTPIHPFWNTLIFTDLSLAITNCTHPSQRVRARINNPPTPYQLTGPVTFPAGHPAINTTIVQYVTVFGEANISLPVVQLSSCNNQVLDGRIRFQGFEIQHSCGNTAPSWNQLVPDPSPLPLALELVNNTWVGNGAAVPAFDGIADPGLVIGDLSPGNGGRSAFYKSIQQGGILLSGYGNIFGGYAGPVVVNITGRTCTVQPRVLLNTWNRCEGSCLKVTQVGGMEVSLNTFNDAMATVTTEPAAVYLSVCQPSGHVSRQLLVQYNTLANSSSGYNPPLMLSTGGYNTGFWIDPVPHKLMKTRIYRNKGYFVGVCMRVDGKVVSYPTADPQKPVRGIALKDFNFQCQGSKYDIRLNQLPVFDASIDANPILYRAYYCNDGCPHTSDVQLGILVGFLTALVMLFWLLVVVALFVGYSRWSKYWSGIAQAYIPINMFKWGYAGVYQKIRRRVHEELRPSA
jgi:hypothetical protein